MTFKVAVDAGHAGFGVTPGKRTPDGEYEWTFNDKVVRAFIGELSKYKGVEIRRFDDPSGKTDIPLATRTNSANAWGADIYVSFHHNASNGKWGVHTGTETYYAAGSSKGKRLADLLQKANVRAYGLRDRGLKTANLHITRETKMPAVLVEGGFMDSTVDIKKMRNDSVLSNAGKYSAQAVAEYAGLKRRGSVSTKPAPSAKVGSEKVSGNIYRVRKSANDAKTQIGAFTSLSNAKALANMHSGYKVYDTNGKLVHSGNIASNTRASSKLPNATYYLKTPYFRGSGVRAVQEALASVYFYPDKGAKNNGIDDVYGPKTADAVKRFQSMYGLVADGQYGPRTRAKLIEAMK